MPEVCLSVGSASLDAIFSDIDYANSKGAGFLEIRFDLPNEIENGGMQDVSDASFVLKLSELAAYAKNKNIKLIATKRAKSGESQNLNAAKIKFLKVCIENGFSFADIEIDIIERPLIKDFIDFAHRKKSKVILSVHNFNKPIDIQTTLQYYLDASYFGADCFKMADTANSGEDIINIIEKNQKLADIKASDSSAFPDFVVFGMGDKGKITRVLSLFYGSSFAYCSSPSGHTAPGQFEVDEFQSEYSRISKIYKF